MRKITHHEDGHGLTELCEVHAGDAPRPDNGANNQAARGVLGKNEK